MTTRVKICGLRTAEEALHAADAGADLIGLNIWPRSPRSVSVADAAAIAARLRALPDPPRIVLVVVLPDVTDLATAIDRVRPDFVQIHGAWGEEGLIDGVPVIRGFGLGDEEDLKEISAWPGELVLVDAKVEGMHGGTGRAVPASLLDHIARLYLLAGGLKPSTVGAIVARFHPWAVDVASGVESSPGVKDPRLVEEFIRNTAGSALT